MAASVPASLLPVAQPGHTPYRAEIDGLRAIAVGGVVAHHTGLGLLPGGFTGVDVFFVISGYLITAIIAAEMTAGKFSQWRFLERRLRRIVPALAVMLAVTAPAAWAILTPEDFRPFAQSLTAAALFASNLLFAQKAGYFDSVEGMQPLLHTWTLGVEEQFYLLFPLVLIACRRWRPGAMLPVVALMGLASFALALVVATRWPLLSFYLLPTRLWEFALGAACALLPARGTELLAARPQIRALLAIAGLGLIAAGFLLIQPHTPAPGAMFLLPTIGTVLVIMFAGASNPAGRLLGLRPLVWLGLISFGTYLWHQPLLTLAQYMWFGDLPLPVTLALVAASVAFGWASYHWIEQPVRQRRLLAGRTALLVACSTALAVPVAAGVSGHLYLLLPASGAEAAQLGGLRPPRAPDVMTGTPSKPLPFILFGDSHAMQYYYALNDRFGEGAILAKSSCLAAGKISNFSTVDAGSAECRSTADSLVNLAAERGVRTIIWAQVWDRELYADDPDKPLAPGSKAAGRALTESMARLADRLPRNSRIVIISNAPTAYVAAPPMFEGWLRCRAFRNADCPEAYPGTKAEGIAINAALRELAARDPRFIFVDAQAPLCPQGTCRIIEDGKLNYWDAHHLTLIGAQRVVATMPANIIER